MDKKTDILKTAQGLFGQFGLKKITVEDIAQEAAVSKATIYKYFRNKNEIFQSVVMIEAEQMLDEIRRTVDKKSTVVGKFKAHLVTKLGRIRELTNFYQVTRRTWSDHWPYLDDAVGFFVEEERKIVRGILEFGNETDELDVEDIDLTARVMVVSLASLEIEWALEKQDITLSGYAELLVNLIMNGLAKK